MNNVFLSLLIVKRNFLFVVFVFQFFCAAVYGHFWLIFHRGSDAECNCVDECRLRGAWLACDESCVCEWIN